MITVLFAAREERWPAYAEHLPQAIAALGIDAEVVLDADPSKVDYIVHAPNGPVNDFRSFTKVKGVLGLWAGVEDIVGNPTLGKIPLTRMVDPALTEGMVEYVAGHVLRHHLGMDKYIHGLNGMWAAEPPPLARERMVTVLGLGHLGAACAETLSRLGFNVWGWSRRRKAVPGVFCKSGRVSMEVLLQDAEVIVLLLPLTAETRHLIDARLLNTLRRDAVLINPGRGGLIDEAALLDALNDGRIGHATLDVFQQEPLPPEHPFWSHPKVTVTPHIASETRPASASRVIAENIRRGEAGEPFLYLVDRKAGY